ncbi:hypothetical protein Bra3105_17710 [Brachybacterium halotolerans subsp. kimchii]|uniref:hypothetical protein n=1 Tax=Brachybacterium halotolerans TaxID=2795215 RepID=UPI001E35DBFD|nr:hypothetical protein [Brachybacterium halotolerans]UEJ82641.1 hypothetical protein Bra3105_17710 [Brachybacterium halotolerans subsp. kimchii]
MTTKTPQDHKTSQAAQDAEKQERFEDIDGHELLKPFSKVKGSDQLRLLAQLRGLGIVDDADDTSEDVNIDDLDFEKVADLIDYVSARFAIDPEKFDEFTTGDGGYDRAMQLAVAYAGELGKGQS